MSQSDDLSKLFQRFGGKTETYKEIVREDAATQARERWPLLSAVRVDRAAAVPPVQPAGAQAQEGAPASAAPLWRSPLPAAPAAEPARAQVPASPPGPQSYAPAAPVTPAPAEAAAPVVPGAAMEPRFRTPQGMAPLWSADAPPVAATPAPAQPVEAAQASHVAHAAHAGQASPAPFWAPAAQPVRPPQPAQAAQPAQPAPAADTELSRVFARLEGRQEPAPASERAPARRSFLDRLKRS
ncbi:cellulose biosynthesis protein BcsP [Cupriavidus sp. 2TAF22]|uniref:cellulose biosynthesis protein BcsP n=1 Tax=unclassified Cupriavidus TaxID=2640874 RepID=UPI003F905A5E